MTPPYPGPAFMFRENYHELILKAQSASASITTCFLFTRLWARATRYKGLWWDDYILLAAWACQMVGNGCSAASPAYGFSMVKGTDFGGNLFFTATSVCYLATAWSKSAFAVTLLRLTFGNAKSILWFVLITLNCFAIVMVVTTWVQICDSAMGDYTSLGDDHCLNFNLVLWLHMGCSIFLLFADVVLAVYPWIVVRNVEMSKKEKRIVASIMSLVGLSGFITLVKLSIQSFIPVEQWVDVDWTYGAFCVMICHSGEAAVTIIAQTVPVLRILYLGSSNPNSARSTLRGQGSKAGTRRARPSGAGINFDTVGSVGRVGIELVQLPTGRIVTAEEARQLGETESPITHESTELPQGAGTTIASQGGGGGGGDGEGEAPAAQETAAERRESDEVHKTWEDLGLSRRAWSKSPPSSPPRGQAN